MSTHKMWAGIFSALVMVLCAQIPALAAWRPLLDAMTPIVVGALVWYVPNVPLPPDRDPQDEGAP